MEPVVGESHLLDSGERRGLDPAAEGVGAAETGVVDHDYEHVGCAFGSRRPRDEGPVGRRLIEGVTCHAAERAVRYRQYRAVRGELAHRLGKRGLELLHAALLGLRDRLGRGAGQRLLDRKPLIVIEHHDDAGRSQRQILADLVVDAALEFVVDEFADDRSAGGPHRDRGEQRRGEQADEYADASAPSGALSAQVVACVDNGHVAVRIVRDKNRAVDLHLLVLDQFDEPVEVLLCRFDALVPSDQDICEYVAHDASTLRRFSV